MNGWKALGFKSYQEYLVSELWQDKRKWILKVFENKCQNCGSKEKLEIHHKNYDSVGNENQHDVTVLCNKCHRGKHG
jgi:5-methylcytosine-specific restriction endonuclease McrA